MQKRFLKALARSIRHNRKMCGLSQQQLADLAGFDVRHIRKMENTVQYNPTIFTLARIASALDISYDELIPELKGKNLTKAKRVRVNKEAFKSVITFLEAHVDD